MTVKFKHGERILVAVIEGQWHERHFDKMNEQYYKCFVEDATSGPSTSWIFAKPIDKK